jgi:hypothetical protein
MQNLATNFLVLHDFRIFRMFLLCFYHINRKNCNGTELREQDEINYNQQQQQIHLQMQVGIEGTIKWQNTHEPKESLNFCFIFLLLAGLTVSIDVVSSVPHLHFVALRRRLDTVTLLENR